MAPIEPETAFQGQAKADKKKEALSLPPENYTVGWICALMCELTAARTILDDVHQPLKSQPKQDGNNYILGQIGEHNITIACLPEYGTNRAATAAKSMQSTFPNLRFCLLVGIGGGVPSKENDIRLGDIVVSTPTGPGGGVIQYDLGRMEVDGFRRLGTLNKPPTLLLTAKQTLGTTRYLGRQISNLVNEAFGVDEESDEEWTYPRTTKDILFEADHKHIAKDLIFAALFGAASFPLAIYFQLVQGSSTAHLGNQSLPLSISCALASIFACAVIAGMHYYNPAMIEHGTAKAAVRKPRQSTAPKIHYGNIASGNSVMKDALERDRLARRDNVICFEMEAAGLMDDFPCLVIRGISDYADSRKNWKWQPYAAAVAAAYAKKLLLVVSPQAVENLERMREIFHDVQKLVRGREHEAILNWLTAVDHAPQHNDCIRRRQPGTGQWFLDSDEFQSWLETDKRTMFCPGIPGAGKTIITALVIDYLQSKFPDDQSTGIAYIYCNFQRQDEQKAENLLESLLKQLAQRRSSLPASVKDLYQRHKKTRTRPSFDEISVTLHSVAATYSKVFIVVDALDECQISDDSRTRFLEKIFKLQDNAVVNIFATSRPSMEISNSFSKGLCRTISATNEDILTYLNAKISLRQSDIIDDEVRDMIRRRVLEAADGMFLLAQLHTDTLLSKLTKGRLKQALQALGKGMAELEKTYHQAMERIEDQGHEREVLAKQILAWIIHSKRPLSTLELQHALAVQKNTTALDTDFIPTTKVMLSLCAGLVTIDEESSIIRLVHYTTQEYFERTQKQWFPEAEFDITTTCITYLSFDSFKSGFCSTDAELEQRMRSNQLYDYAARNWGRHAHEASIPNQEALESQEARAKVEALSRLAISFLESKAKVEASSQAMLATEQYPNYSQNAPRNMTGLHLAAYFGLAKATEALINNGQSVDPTDSTGRTPLSWSAANGHAAAVEILLEKGAQPNLKDEDSRTPLSWAIEGQGAAVVKLLLDKRAEVDYCYKFVSGFDPK